MLVCADRICGGLGSGGCFRIGVFPSKSVFFRFFFSFFFFHFCPRSEGTRARTHAQYEGFFCEKKVIFFTFGLFWVLFFLLLQANLHFFGGAVKSSSGHIRKSFVVPPLFDIQNGDTSVT